MKIAFVVTALLVIIFIIAFHDQNDDQETIKQIVLLEGSNEWDVFVGGIRTIWKLDYKNYDELPIKNSDFGSVIEYQGKKYTLLRVYSNQIQVSSEITDSK